MGVTISSVCHICGNRTNIKCETCGRFVCDKCLDGVGVIIGDEVCYMCAIALMGRNPDPFEIAEEGRK